MRTIRHLIQMRRIDSDSKRFVPLGVIDFRKVINDFIAQHFSDNYCDALLLIASCNCAEIIS
jgi:hypothetical protein